MSKRKKPDYGKLIYEYFIGPVVKFAQDSEASNSQQALDVFFGSNMCQIREYRLKRPIKHIQGSQTYGPSDGRRSFPKNWIAFVRFDKRHPDRIDVNLTQEWGGPGPEYQFSMRPEDYKNRVAGALEALYDRS